MTPSAASATQHEPPAESLERIAECGEGAVQPPPRGAAERTDAGRLLVEHVDAHDRRPALDRGVQRRMVRDAQVVAEPDDRRRVALMRRP